MSVGGIRPLVAALVPAGQLVERQTPRRGTGAGRPGTVLAPVLPDGRRAGPGLRPRARPRSRRPVWTASSSADERRRRSTSTTTPTTRWTARRRSPAACCDRAGRPLSAVRPRGRRRARTRSIGRADASSTIVASWAQLAIADEVAAPPRGGAGRRRRRERRPPRRAGRAPRRGGDGLCRTSSTSRPRTGWAPGWCCSGELYRGARGLSRRARPRGRRPRRRAVPLRRPRLPGDGRLDPAGPRDQLRLRAPATPICWPRSTQHPAARRIVVDVGRALGPGAGRRVHPARPRAHRARWRARRGRCPARRGRRRVDPPLRPAAARRRRRRPVRAGRAGAGGRARRRWPAAAPASSSGPPAEPNRRRPKVRGILAVRNRPGGCLRFTGMRLGCAR